MTAEGRGERGEGRGERRDRQCINWILPNLDKKEDD